jgi:SAM-dependent methyltransferase
MLPVEVPRPRPSSPPPPKPTALGRKFSPAEVAILETFVVPRYLAKFGEAVLSMMLLGDTAKIAHFGCRTGYPDRELLQKSDGSSIVGVDASLAAVELARNKAATLGDVALSYRVESSYPTELEADSFSHAMSLHPVGGERERVELFREMARVLYSGGQALVSLPLRGSFQEIGDLFREYALKFDHGDFGKATEIATLSRPTLESLSDELEAAGLEDVDVDIRQVSLPFESGRAFTEDPVTRLFIMPDFQAYMGIDRFEEPLRYLNDAIGKYWANRQFEVGLVVGTASARKS